MQVDDGRVPMSTLPRMAIVSCLGAGHLRRKANPAGGVGTAAVLVVKCVGALLLAMSLALRAGEPMPRQPLPPIVADAGDGFEDVTARAGLTLRPPVLPRPDREHPAVERIGWRGV